VHCTRLSISFEIFKIQESLAEGKVLFSQEYEVEKHNFPKLALLGKRVF